MPEKSGAGALFVFLTVFFMCVRRGRVCAVIEPLVSGGIPRPHDAQIRNLKLEMRN